MIEPIVFHYNEQELQNWTKKHQAESSSFFYLNCKGIEDAKDFWEAAKMALPLNPPLGNGLKWDAMEDSIFSGISELTELIIKPRIVFILLKTEDLKIRNKSLYDDILLTFQLAIEDIKRSTSEGGLSEDLGGLTITFS